MTRKRKANKIPADFTFTFVANDGRTYPVYVEFLARLPCVTLVGPVNRIDFRDRAGLHLHTVLPRCRVIVTVDDSDLAADIEGARALEDNDFIRATLRLRSSALRGSGVGLADQLFIALQARRF